MAAKQPRSWFPLDELFWRSLALLLRLRYRFTVTGLAEVERRGTTGILFLPNHPAIIDPVIVMAHLYPTFKPRSLADEDQMARPIIGRLARWTGAIVIPDVERHGPEAQHRVREGLDACIAALRAGENLLLYPAGHASHAWFDDLGSNSAVETILRALPTVRTVLLRTKGLWGSSLSWAGGCEPSVGAAVRRVLPGMVASGLVGMPRRAVTLTFSEPDSPPRTGSRRELNRYLEDFYNGVTERNTYVPYSIWSSQGPQVLPEPPLRRLTGDVGSVPLSTRRLVEAKLRSLAGLEADAAGVDATGTDTTGADTTSVGLAAPDVAPARTSGSAPLSPDSLLARDLGLDSLQRAELLVWLTEEFGFSSENVDALQTVGDVLLAATTRTTAAEPFRLRAVPQRWFDRTRAHRPVVIHPGSSLSELFLAQAARRPGVPCVADQTSGVKTYRDVVTAINVLKPHLTALSGSRVGLLMPASVGAFVAYQALLLAGKTPLWVNWTTGSRSMRHVIDSLAVDHVVTARPVVDTLRARGVDLSELAPRFRMLDELAAATPAWRKATCLFDAWFDWSSVRTAAEASAGRPAGDGVAAVLVTSGSEALPKAVPLTHRNVLTNVHDIVRRITFYEDDVFLGIRKVIWLGAGIAGDDTHGHVDDIARFVEPGRVVLAYEPDPGDLNHSVSVDNMRRLKQTTDAAGRPLRRPAPHRGPPLPGLALDGSLRRRPLLRGPRRRR